jgi:hypothetical protein
MENHIEFKSIYPSYIKVDIKAVARSILNPHRTAAQSNLSLS